MLELQQLELPLQVQQLEFRLPEPHLQQEQQLEFRPQEQRLQRLELHRVSDRLFRRENEELPLRQQRQNQLQLRRLGTVKASTRGTTEACTWESGRMASLMEEES